MPPPNGLMSFFVSGTRWYTRPEVDTDFDASRDRYAVVTVAT